VIWLAIAVGAVLVVGIAVFAVARVSVELEGTMAPALLEIDDAVEVIGESIPYEVSAVVSHEDVDEIIRWVLDWFDRLGLVSDFGEEMGGDWVEQDRVVVDEIGVIDHAVARGVEERPELDSVHITVIADAFVQYLRDIGAVGDEVQ